MGILWLPDKNAIQSNVVIFMLNISMWNWHRCICKRFSLDIPQLSLALLVCNWHLLGNSLCSIFSSDNLGCLIILPLPQRSSHFEQIMPYQCYCHSKIQVSSGVAFLLVALPRWGINLFMTMRATKTVLFALSF